MRVIFIIILLLSTPGFVSAQDTVYFADTKTKGVSICDSEGNKTDMWKIYQWDGTLWRTANMSTGEFKQFAWDGKLTMEGKNVNGLRDGEWKFYDDNGRMKHMVLYSEGKSILVENFIVGKRHDFFHTQEARNGEWKTYVNGKLRGRRIYANGSELEWWIYHKNGNLKEHSCVRHCPEGERAWYYKSGNPWHVIKFKDGTWVEDLLFYNKKEKVKEHGFYTNNNRHGEWKNYRRNGRVYKISLYQHDTLKTVEFYRFGKPTGTVEEYYGTYARARIKSAGKYKNKLKAGRWKYYYETAGLMATCRYKKGQLTGVYREFHENGNPRSFVRYKQGLREGEFVSYDYYGAINAGGKYRHGCEVGEWKIYSNGNLTGVGLRRDGWFTGHWKFYYENGHLQKEGSLKYSQLVGEWKYYYKNGQLSTVKNHPESVVPNEQNRDILGASSKYVGEYRIYYENGQPHALGFYDTSVTAPQRRQGEWRSYYENGQLEYIGIYRDGQWFGEWKSFYKNGQLKSICRIENGTSEGDCKTYYENGQLNTEATYKDGQVVGKLMFYDENGKLIEN